MDALALRCCQSQQQSDRLLLEVDALALDKASGDEARLVLDNGTTLVPLDLIHPLQADQTTS